VSGSPSPYSHPAGILSCSRRTRLATATRSAPTSSRSITQGPRREYFEPQASWPAPDEVPSCLSLMAPRARDATVEVTAQQNGSRVYKGEASRNPTERNVWDATSTTARSRQAPTRSYAYPTDVADNSGSITTDHAGGTRKPLLPFRDMTEISDTAHRRHGQGERQRAAGGIRRGGHDCAANQRSLPRTHRDVGVPRECGVMQTRDDSPKSKARRAVLRHSARRQQQGGVRLPSSTAGPPDSAGGSPPSRATSRSCTRRSS